MKTHFISINSLLRWLILAILLFGGVFPNAQKVQAAGPCSSTSLHSGIIAADETWCAGGDNTHYLTDDVIVQTGVTLTIEAGVTVDSLESTWSKYLIVQGHLDINGTADQPVLLTRSINYPIQNWSGLFFDGSQGGGSGSIHYATITHAGSNFLPPGCTGTCGNAQTAVFVKDLGTGKQVTIDHSTITDNTAKGLFVVDGTVNVTNTSFSQNKYPIWIEGANSVLSYSGNTFTNNAYPYYDNVNYTVHEDSIILGPDALTGQDFSLPVQNGLEAYVFPEGTTIPVERTMSIDPGVTLRMSSEKYLTVQGSLHAVGTSALPIHFNSIPSSNPDDKLNWGGLFFDGNSSGGGGLISHAIIEQGGSNFLPTACSGTCGTAQTAVFIKDLPAGIPLTFSNSTIQDSLVKGLFVVNSQAAHLDNNLIKRGRIGAHFVTNMTVSNLALIDQASDAVIVANGFTVDARHLTIVNAGQSGFHVLSGGTGLLRNSILSHNALAVWSEGSASTSLNTNLSDTNTTFQTGSVMAVNTIDGSALLKGDGYHINPTSAAVGVGLDGLSSVDIDGEARPWPAGTHPDLGADEISAGMFFIFLPTVLR